MEGVENNSPGVNTRYTICVCMGEGRYFGKAPESDTCRGLPEVEFIGFVPLEIWLMNFGGE